MSDCKHFQMIVGSENDYGTATCTSCGKVVRLTDEDMFGVAS
jgi:hypothetical protein